MLIISFGRFHHLSKDEIEKEKEDFLKKKGDLLLIHYVFPIIRLN